MDFSHALQQGPGSQAERFAQIVIEWNAVCEKENPDWRVNIREAGQDYGNPVKVLDLPEDQRPTFVLAPEFMKPKMEMAVTQGAVSSIDAFLSPEILASISDVAKRAFSNKEGKLECLPLNPACPGMFVNKDVLAFIGRDPSWTPSSREELDQVAQEIFAKREELVAKGLLVEGFGIYTCAWPAAYLVEIPHTQGNNPLITPDNGRQGYGDYQLSSALNLFRQLRQDVEAGVFIYGGQQLGSRDLFLQKKTVFYGQGLGHWDLLNKLISAQESKFELGVGSMPAPRGLAGRVYAVPTGGASIWVVNTPKAQSMVEGVRAFLNYLASQKVMTQWHIDTSCVPVLQTTYEELEKGDFYKSHPVHKAAVQQTLESQPGDYSSGFHAPNWAEARKEIFTVIEQVIARDPDGKFVLTDEQVVARLKEFDARWSIPKP